MDVDGAMATATSATTAGLATAAATAIVAVTPVAIVAVTQADIAVESAWVPTAATLVDIAAAIPVRFVAERSVASTVVRQPVADSMAAAVAMAAAADAANPAS
jgi:hypothetical protein